MNRDSIKSIKIFLASPGGLAEERALVKKVVDEYNENSAEFHGYQIKLIGWEHTVSVFGRPQATINLELQQCEYFIGLMWDYWGSAPDITGDYTSGFEEEFKTSVNRRENTDQPEISLFFKAVDNKQLKDPGEHLKKVLEFKKKLIDEKKIIFQDFQDTSELETKIRACIYQYIHKLRQEDKLVEVAKSQSDSNTSIVERNDDKRTNVDTPFSQEGSSFLSSLIEANESGHELSDEDVARFRLIASIISRAGNDDISLETHDANVLFNCRNKMELSLRETRGLVSTGLEHYAWETVPLWHWLINGTVQGTRNLIFYSYFGEKSQQTGALSAMRLVSEPLPVTGPISRSSVVTTWLLEQTEIPTKLEALKYLAEHGIEEDLPQIYTELERKNSQTKRSAIDAVLLINLRSNHEKAVSALFELQPDTVSESLVDEIFELGTSLDNEILFSHIGSRSVTVRRKVVSLLGSGLIN